VPVFSRLIFQAVHWAARAGLRDECDDSRSDETSEAPKDPATESPELSKLRARRTGIRGETYGYWYLRRHGYVFVARNYMPRGAEGEIDLVGYDGDTLAFVEVRTHTVRDDALPALPELSVTTDKQRVVVRTICPCRVDVLAIDNRPGMPPEVRLHKDAFSPQMSSFS